MLGPRLIFTFAQLECGYGTIWVPTKWLEAHPLDYNWQNTSIYPLCSRHLQDLTKASVGVAGRHAKANTLLVRFGKTQELDPARWKEREIVILPQRDITCTDVAKVHSIST